jgi:hypothetical protein
MNNNGFDWRVVPDFPDYSVSRFGDVLSHRSGRCLKAYPIKDYPCVSLHSGGRRKVARVHRLIAAAYYGPCPTGLQCAHLDGNPANNVASNLSWVTKSENEKHKVAHGKTPRGERAPRATLTNEVAGLVREAVKRPLTRREVAALAGISHTMVEGILDLGTYAVGNADAPEPQFSSPGGTNDTI